MLLTVGRIGRAHGVRGEVTVEVRTDDPGARFEPGAILLTDPSSLGPLKIETVREHNGRLLLCFEGKADRNSAEALRNTWLLADVEIDADHSIGEFHITEIVGLKVFTETGAELGEVIDVLSLPSQDTLVIKSNEGEVLIPFVKHHVPEVDISSRRIVVANIEGLR